MKKIRKIAVYLLSLTILCGCFGGMGSVRAEEELPATVTWDLNEGGGKTGIVTVTLTQELYNEYYGKPEYSLEIALLKNGVKILQPTHYLNNLVFSTWWQSLKIMDSGQYHYEVSFRKYNRDKQTGDPYDRTLVGKSDVFDYTRPAQELVTPSNIKWDENNIGTITWDEVEGADSYAFMIKDERGSSSTIRVYQPSYSVTNIIQGDLKYFVTVQACSNNPAVVANSKESELVEIVDEDITDSLDNKLSEILNQYENYDKDNATPAENAAIAGLVQNLTADNQGNLDQNELNALQIGMQNDSGILGQVEDLEELYKESNNVDVTTNVDPNAGFDSSKVSIVGAALNANAGSNMNFGIEKADENSKVLVDQSMFTNPVQYNFSLSGTFNGTGQFRIPVRVTMPNPSNTPTYKLVILHYKADGTYETIRPYDNGDGTISFTVTSFSPFVFVEEVDQNQNNNVSSGGGWNWEPTAEELKRLNFKGQYADVSNIVSNYRVSFKGVSQGPLFFQSVATLGDKYTMIATYNVSLDHQLLYEHEGVTQITLNLPSFWQKLDGELVMVGVNKQGTPIVCTDLDDNAKTFTFEVADAYAYALCLRSK
jgi:hypothetical protein